MEKNQISPFKRWLCAAMCTSFAETTTFPIDVAKVRLQVQNELVRGTAKRLGMFQTLFAIAKGEGVRALYMGLPAAVLRQAVYGGIGIGFYRPIRNLLSKEGSEIPLYQRIFAGMLTGALGQSAAQPCDVCKVRLQADLLGKGAARYTGVVDAFVSIFRQEGVATFYRGTLPSVQRAALINGTGLATYDHAKHSVLKLGLEDNVWTHTLASMISGIASAGVSNPFDVVKTRILNSRQAYKGPIDCLLRTVRTEGVMALYKGFMPTWLRLGPWQLVFFLAYERLAKAFGLSGFG